MKKSRPSKKMSKDEFLEYSLRQSAAVRGVSVAQLKKEQVEGNSLSAWAKIIVKDDKND